MSDKQLAHQAKQEAKSLLLKGCYKMAMNKYIRIVQNGSEHFTQRQWSIINLNLGISYLFQNQLEKALQQTNLAIKIDPTYDKAYYRRLQILQDMFRYEEAISSIPNWLKAANKETAQLVKKIEQEFKNNLFGAKVEDILKKVEQQSLPQHFIENLLSNLDEKIAAMDANSEEKCGHSIVEYYKFLEKKLVENQSSQQGKKQYNYKQLWEKWISVIKKIIVLSSMQKQFKILNQFWKEFIVKNQNINSLSEKELQLVLLCPVAIYSEDIFLKVLRILLIDKAEKFYEKQLEKFMHINTQALSKLSHNKKLNSTKISAFIDEYSLIVKKELENDNVDQAMNHLICVHAIIRFNKDACKLPFSGWKTPNIQRFGDVIQYAYQIQSKFPHNSKYQIAELQSAADGVQSLLTVALQKRLYPIIYILQQLASTFQQTSLKQSSSLLLKAIQSQKTTLFWRIIIQNMLLKIDITKGKDTEVDLQSYKNLIDILKKQKKQQLSWKEIHILQNILLLCLNNVNNTYLVLLDKKMTNQIIHVFGKLILTQHSSRLQRRQQKQQHAYFIQFFSVSHITRILLLINLLHIMINDQQAYLQHSMALQMGVTKQEIHKARQLQHESNTQQFKSELSGVRKWFGQSIPNGFWWKLAQLINQLENVYGVSHEQISHCKCNLIRIINQIAQYTPSKFANKSVLTLLSSIKLPTQENKGDIKKQNIDLDILNNCVRSLSKIVKDVSTQLLPFEKISAMVIILEWGINNSDHQLTIFQCLLSLINLSSHNKINISMQTVLKGLFEQNQYIVHGSFELMNNFLLSHPQQDEKKLQQAKEFLLKYLQHYRERIKIITKQPTKQPVTDYSHPYKIYCTLLSVALVMKMDEKVQQLRRVELFKNNLEMMQAFCQNKNIKNKDLAYCLFKMMAHYCSEENVEKFKKQVAILKKTNTFTRIMQILEQIDKEKWVKIKQLIH